MQASFTIPGWCAHRKVSRSMFYKLESQGLAPATYSVGTSRRISPDADAAWLRQREAAASLPPGQFNRLTQEAAAATTVEDANEILSTVNLHELSEDEIAKLIDVARAK